jgi:hypothetical protein
MIPSFQLFKTNGPVHQTINNGITHVQHGMPQKDITSDGDSSFSIARANYKKIYTVIPPHANNTTITPLPSTPPQYIVNGTSSGSSGSQNKKWYGNRDASQIIANRRISQIGKGSLNQSGSALSFQTKNDINVRRDALIRTRSSGYVTTPKIRNKPNNGLTPSWPIGPLVRTSAQTAVGWSLPCNGENNSCNRGFSGQLNTPIWRTKGNTVCDVPLYGHCDNENIQPKQPLYH